MKLKRIKPNQKLYDYMDAHPFCEACGTQVSPSALPHHIKTRGSGGNDETENLLRLCYDCHYFIAHGLPGIAGLVAQYPHLYNKVTAIKYKMNGKEDEKWHVKN